MAKIKAIIFDIGGVLCKEKLEYYPKISKKFNLDLNKLYEVRKKYYKLASTGKLSAYRYPASLARDMGVKNIKEFVKTWDKLKENSFKIYKEVKKTIINLGKNYIVGTLTNSSKSNDKPRLKKNIYRYFKINLVSNKVGLMKPDLRFYKLLIKKLKLESAEIVFVDDKEKHLKPAGKLGMKTILFENNKQLVKDLEKLGVEK